MITCPRTGQTWPDEKSIDLRTCIVCGGKIDIRVEAWKGTSAGQLPHHVTCPTIYAPTVGDTAPTVGVKTGAEVIEAMAKFRDVVHEEATKLAHLRNVVGCAVPDCDHDENPDCEIPRDEEE